MAFLYQRDRSPFWWVRWRDEHGKIQQESTGFKVGVGSEKRRAEAVCAQKTLEEKKANVAAPTTGQWDAWVVPFIEAHPVGPRTVERYLSAWRTVRMFLIEKEIKAPRFVTYQLCTAYLPWREKSDVKAGKYNAVTNTAIFEMKIFRWLLKEAVKREYCSGNPAREVTLKKKARKLYSDYSDERMQEIYAAIKLEPEPDLPCFLRSFGVASLHGCRLNETNVNPMTDVDLSGEIPTIRFLQKGNRERIKPLHPQLIPLYRKLKKEKATLTYPMEKDENGRFRWGNKWTKFWHRHGFKEIDPNGCFHSLRVVVENALREAKVELEIREAYLTHEHGSDEVNAMYDRIKLREMLVCHAPLNRPWLVLV